VMATTAGLSTTHGEVVIAVGLSLAASRREGSGTPWDGASGGRGAPPLPPALDTYASTGRGAGGEGCGGRRGGLG
jgi:hypothetical protein